MHDRLGPCSARKLTEHVSRLEGEVSYEVGRYGRANFCLILEDLKSTSISSGNTDFKEKWNMKVIRSIYLPGSRRKLFGHDGRRIISCTSPGVSVCKVKDTMRAWWETNNSEM